MSSIAEDETESQLQSNGELNGKSAVNGTKVTLTSKTVQFDDHNREKVVGNKKETNPTFNTNSSDKIPNGSETVNNKEAASNLKEST